MQSKGRLKLSSFIFAAFNTDCIFMMEPINTLATVSMPATAVLNLLIVGGGPIGLNCGLEAKKAGLEYLIVEKGALVNSLYNYPMNMTFFSTSERLEIGGVP